MVLCLFAELNSGWSPLPLVNESVSVKLILSFPRPRMRAEYDHFYELLQRVDALSKRARSVALSLGDLIQVYASHANKDRSMYCCCSSFVDTLVARASEALRFSESCSNLHDRAAHYPVAELQQRQDELDRLIRVGNGLLQLICNNMSDNKESSIPDTPFPQEPFHNRIMCAVCYNTAYVLTLGRESVCED